MNEILVKNYSDADAEVQSQNGNTFTVKSIIPKDLISKCSS